MIEETQSSNFDIQVEANDLVAADVSRHKLIAITRNVKLWSLLCRLLQGFEICGLKE